jgi:hypothetical protein
MLTTSITPAPAREPTKVTGRVLGRILRGATPLSRAHMAAEFSTGRWVLVAPLPTQAARLCDVNVACVSVTLGNKGKRGPRKATIDRVVKRFGVAALMAGLDRATAPNNSNGTATIMQAAE